MYERILLLSFTLSFDNDFPSTKISPLLGVNRPKMFYNNVVLPLPFLPRSAIVSPLWHEKDMLSSILLSE